MGKSNRNIWGGSTQNLVSRFRSNLDQNKIALAAFLDIEGVFDNTSLQAVNSAFEIREVNHLICRGISNNYGTVIMCKHTRSLRPTRAGPQGMWNLVINNLISNIKS